jgi:energy-converting hydrogenase Eha subunit C
MEPVAYAQPAAAATSGGLRTTSGATALIKHSKADFTEDNAGAINLKSGEMLISAAKDTIVKSGDVTVQIHAGTIALVTHENGIVKVRNMWETGAGTIREVVANKYFDVAAGQETIVSADETRIHESLERDMIGRRRTRLLDIPGGYKLSRCELSMVSLIQNTDMLTNLINSQNAADKALAGKLIKMAAVLTQITGRHGQFQSIKQK